MSKRPALALAATPDTAPAAASSPRPLIGARLALDVAQRRLRIAGGVAERAGTAYNRAAGLLTVETMYREALAELEAEAGRFISDWAVGNGDRADIPDDLKDRLSTARNRVEAASLTASAARHGLPALEQAQREAAAAVKEAQDAVLAAARAVLVEDAGAIVAELEMLLDQVAERRALLAGLSVLLRRQGTASGSHEPFVAAEQLGRMEPNERLPERVAINAAAKRWEALADALCAGDATVALEGTT